MKWYFTDTNIKTSIRNWYFTDSDIKTSIINWYCTDTNVKRSIINWYFACVELYNVWDGLSVYQNHTIMIEIESTQWDIYFSLMRQHSSYFLPCEISLLQPVNEIRISCYFSRKNVTLRKIALHHGSVFICINKTTILPHKYFCINLYMLFCYPTIER